MSQLILSILFVSVLILTLMPATHSKIIANERLLWKIVECSKSPGDSIITGYERQDIFNSKYLVFKLYCKAPSVFKIFIFCWLYCSASTCSSLSSLCGSECRCRSFWQSSNTMFDRIYSTCGPHFYQSNNSVGRTLGPDYRRVRFLLLLCQSCAHTTKLLLSAKNK